MGTANPWTDWEQEMAPGLFETYGSVTEVARILGRNRITVAIHLRAMGYDTAVYSGGGYPQDVKDEAVGRYLEGDLVREIAEDLGIHARRIPEWVKRAGYPVRTLGRKPQYNRAEMRRLYRKLGDQSAVAARMGCSPSCVNRVLRGQC